jgi:hypothetical protein
MRSRLITAHGRQSRGPGSQTCTSRLWTSDAPRPHLAQLAELERRLTHETRVAILWIKDVWHRLPVYPYEVGGMEVYDAVLEHGARSPDDFDLYLRQRGLPARWRSLTAPVV